MSEKQTDNMNNPVSQIELAAWAVVSEPIDAAAVDRVKENAKRLAISSSLEDDSSAVESKKVYDRQRGSSRLGAWMIRGGIAAAIGAIVCGTLLMPSDKSAAFAAALKKLDIVKVLSFDQTIYAENLDEPAENHITVNETGRWRSEGAGSVSIFDESGIARLTLLKQTGTAIVHDAVEGLGSFDQLEWLRDLKSFENETTTDLGDREIKGVMTFGKEIQIDMHRFNVWVDAQSEELVMVEHFFPDDSPIEKSVITNFNFEEEADASLFSFEVPENYNVHKVDEDMMRMVMNPEENLVDLMRAHAELAEGKFPTSLRNWGEWSEVLTLGGKTNTKLAGLLGGLTPFLASMRNEDHAYLGDGVFLDQPERVVVFWYRKDGQLRAVYSDLKVSDIEEAKLPPTEPRTSETLTPAAPPAKKE